MSGTSPEKVNSSSGGPNEPPSKKVEAVPKSGNAKHARAVSIKDDTTHFGWDSSFTKSYDQSVQDAEANCWIWKHLDPSSTKEETVKERLVLRQKLVSATASLVASVTQAKDIHYGERVLHEYYIKKLEKASNVLKDCELTLESFTVKYISENFASEDEVEEKSPIKENSTQKAEDAKKASFAEATERSEKAPITTSLSWADLVEEDLREQARVEIESTRLNLVAAIRSKTGLSQENRVEVPGNLKEVLPHFYSKVQIAAKLAGCELLENPKIKIDLARREVWGNDEIARAEILSTLYNKDGQPSNELHAIANMGVLIDSLLEVPSMDNLQMTGPGRLGTFHSISLLMRVYCEQKFSVPIAKQRNWWKGGPELRQQMLSQVASQVGGELPATCILNCYDILYRKFIRKVLNGKSESSINNLHKIANDFSKRLFSSGGALFTNLLKVETKTRKVEQELPNKKGKSQKVFVEQRYKARIRPSILDGPKTAFESAVFAKVNSALAKIEKKADNYSLDSEKYSSPIAWEEAHKTWVEDLYQRAKIPSSLVAQRKQTIRARIIAQIVKDTQQQNGSAAGIVPNAQKITSAQWMNAQSAYLAENEEAFDKASVSALNNMLRTTHNKEGLLQLAEDAIIGILSF